MKYISTRGGIAPIEFQDAVLMGLADDGGLVIPQSIPDVRDRLGAWRNLNYVELAMQILPLFVTDIPPADLRKLIEKSYIGPFDGDVAPTVKVGPAWLLELWHGPTLAFKDVALQLLGNLFEYILARRGGRLNILGATSGDTGSAAIYGVRGRKGIDIFMMHPQGRTSAIQERQMTTVLDANVHNLAVKGTFDDCQLIMKELAGDLEFKRRYSLGAVNSVNWARVLAQIVYYFYSAFAVQKATGAPAVQFSVPTGNFGDVLAGWYAMKMGLPIERLILATNENDILAVFFKTGVYSRGRSVHETLSPSMDIQVASNFERYLYHLLGQDSAKLKAVMAEFAATGRLKVAPGPDGQIDGRFVSDKADRKQVLARIAEFHQKYQYLLDPHSAVGVDVGLRLAAPDLPLICLATAHPAKFPDAIREATGQDLAHHPAIDALANLPARCKMVPFDRQAVRRYIERTLGY